MNDPQQKFQEDCDREIEQMSANAELKAMSRKWLLSANDAKYSYHFRWLDRPIIQYPQDIVAFQELVWQVRPDVIVETGIAHGGSLILSASLLSLIDLCEATEAGEMLDPSKPKRRVVGVDIDIRSHNREAIEAHPMARRISMVQGSSIDPSIVAQMRDLVGDAKRVMVCLDSNHTHEHVLAELDAYAPMVSRGSYCIVFDTVIEDLPAEMFPDRPWGPGDNPKSAVHAWLPAHPEFEIDTSIDAKLMISVAPEGYLKRIA
ncbi:MAG: cephalosporin hydroxylase family protein [Rhizobiaceae bacterium]